MIDYKYSPDNWVILKLKAGKLDSGIYKVLGGWSGGYLDGDSWRMNSGITEVKEDENYYYFYGYSGSCYRCGKQSYGLRMNNAGVYNSLKEKEGFENQVTLMDEDTDWMNIRWQYDIAY